MITKNSIKQFLKQDLRKIAILFVLLVLSVVISYNGTDCMMEGGGCTNNYGLPFTVYFVHHYDLDVLHDQPDHPPTFSSLNYFSVIPNLIFWYLVSCLLISIRDKIKAKKPVV